MTIFGFSFPVLLILLTEKGLLFCMNIFFTFFFEVRKLQKDQVLLLEEFLSSSFSLFLFIISQNLLLIPENLAVFVLFLHKLHNIMTWNRNDIGYLKKKKVCNLPRKKSSQN